jgi:hypothetical protein
MNFKLNILAIVAICLSAITTTFAQTFGLDGVKYITLNSIQPIMEGREVKGYTMFYRIDKADKKMDNYSLKILDENLKEIKTITIQQERGAYFMGNTFNGDVLGLLFFNSAINRSKCTYTLETYDKTLKKIATKKTETLSQYEASPIIMGMNGSEYSTELSRFFPSQNRGFVLSGVEDYGKGFNLTLYDNNLKQVWRYATDKKAKEVEKFTVSEVTNKYVLGIMIRSKGVMSTNFTFSSVVFDVATGKKILDLPVSPDEKEPYSLNGVSLDEEKDELVVQGDFFKSKDKPSVARSIGFYIKRVNIATSKEVSKARYLWDKEVKSVLPAEGKADLENKYAFFTHKVVRAADGKSYIIAEEYKRVADGMGIAMAVLSRGQSNTALAKVQMANMVVFTINADLTMAGAKVFQKDISSYSMPAGMDFYGLGMCGMYLKALGGFDYQFTKQSVDGNTFNSAYINYDKEKGQKSKTIIGNIILDDSKKLVFDKVDINSDANIYRLFPAISGYITLMEYNRKAKKVGMRLVKCAFLK